MRKLGQFIKGDTIQVGIQFAYGIKAGDGRDAVALPIIPYLHVEGFHSIEVGRSPLALVHKVPAVLPDVLGLLINGEQYEILQCLILT